MNRNATSFLHVFTLSSTAKAFFNEQFKFFSLQGYKLFLSSSDDEDVEFCNYNRVKYTKINIVRKIDVKSDIVAIIDLIKFIRDNNIQIVFGHTPKGSLISMVASWLAGCKHRIYYRHGLIYTTANGFKRLLLKNIERLTALLATDIINVSPSLSTIALKDHLNSKTKQYVIGKGTCGGIDAKKLFNPDLIDRNKRNNIEKKHELSKNDFIIGFCGRICRDKGIIELLKGYKLFNNKHPRISAKLLLIGDYDDRDILSEDIKKELECDPNIIITGFIPHKDIPLYYDLMSVFVFPSYREGFGMSVIEASAMRIPILVSKSHGCIDSIDEHNTGEYIDISPESICSGLEKMTDIDLRTNYGNNGRMFVIDNFDYTVMWPQILKLYRKILDK